MFIKTEYDDYYNYNDDYDEEDYIEPEKPANPTQTKATNQKINKPQQKQNKSSCSQPKPSMSNQQQTKISKHAAPLPTNTKNNVQTKQTKKGNLNLNVKEYEEFVKSSKPRINLVVVGHVDSGKSTLVGHILCEIGYLTQKQMHKNEIESHRSGKASFKYAWALDETEEERLRGVTIDIAFTKFETQKRVIVVVDSPGHVDFVPAVISGAAQADSAILVVDSSPGEFETGFERGQTREHAFLVRSLGVKSLIVAVNKMDIVDWDWERFCEIKTMLETFLRQAGFNMREDVQFIACSGLTGENLVERRRDIYKNKGTHPQLEISNDSWRSMPCLMEALDKLPVPSRIVDRPTRVVVNDIYKGQTGGVFIGGKVCAGKIAVKQSLLLMPPDETCDVKSVEVKDVTNGLGKAFAGDIVNLVTTGIDLNKFYRGCVLCDPSAPCRVTNRFQARIVMFQGVDVVLIRGTSVEIHMNGMYESGEIRRLLSLIDKTSGEMIRMRPKCVPRNSSAIIQFRLNRPVCMELYCDNKDLGRFMVRSCGKTIAAGLVTKIKAAKVVSARKMKSK